MFKTGVPGWLPIPLPSKIATIHNHGRSGNMHASGLRDAERFL
jgi:hypothetical protein